MLMDNFDFFELEDIRLAQQEASLPRCDRCGEPMDEYYEIQYKLQTWMFCPNCVEHRYVEG